MKTFNNNDEKILKEELKMRINDYFDYLEDNDHDEPARHRLHLLIWLYGMIDKIEIEIDDEVIEKYFEENF